MIEKQINESIEDYKKRILFIVTFILPNIDADQLYSTENYDKFFGDYSQEDKDILNHRISLTIREVYQIGIDVLKNSSCINAEKNLNDIFISLKNELDELQRRKSIENKMLSLLEKKLSFIEDEMENALDYNDFKNLSLSRDVSSINYKNIVEANNRNKISLDELSKKIGKVKEIADLLKLSREIIKS